MIRVLRPAVAASRSAVRSVGGRGVEVLGRLVEHQDRKVGQQRPSDGKALPLPAGEALSVFADLGVEAVRQPVDPVEQPGGGQGRA